MAKPYEPPTLLLIGPNNYRYNDDVFSQAHYVFDTARGGLLKHVYRDIPFFGVNVIWWGAKYEGEELQRRTDEAVSAIARILEHNLHSEPIAVPLSGYEIEWCAGALELKAAELMNEAQSCLVGLDDATEAEKELIEKTIAKKRRLSGVAEGLSRKLLRYVLPECPRPGFEINNG